MIELVINMISSRYSPTQLATVPDHCPLASHFLIIDPWSLYPALQSNTTRSPYVNLSPILKPFAKDPGSPQLTTNKKNQMHYHFRPMRCDPFGQRH